MASLKGTGKQLRLLARRMQNVGSATVRVVALSIDQPLVLSTPVDTGRARSNWIAEIGAVPAGVIEPYHPYPSGRSRGLGDRANANAAIRQVSRVVAKYKTGTVYLVNNVHYMRLLDEDGHSPQAAPGFVGRAIDAGFDRAGAALPAVLKRVLDGGS